MSRIKSIKEQRQNELISWSNSDNYEDARKEWTLLRKASDDKRCELCGRPLEHPVYVKNTVTNEIRIVGSGCCQTYITDVDSDDPKKSFKRRLEEAEDRYRFENELEVAEQNVESFYCPFTGKLPMITDNCSKCSDEFVKRLCEHFFLFPEVNLAKYRKYNLSDKRFSQIQNRIQKRSIEEFVRIAREMEDKTCGLLVSPTEMSCNSCIKFVNGQMCENSIWVDSLLPLKDFFVKLAGPKIYKETINGLIEGQDIRTGNILKIVKSTKSTISMFKCPVTGLFPQSNMCNQECSATTKVECSRTEAYFEAFMQSGGINCRDIAQDHLTCEAKDELLNRLNTDFSQYCSLITDPSMPLSDCLKYNCFATLNSKTCPFDKKHKSMVDRIEKIDKLDAIDHFASEREREKRRFFYFRKVAYYRLKESYVELIEIHANKLNYFGALAERLSKEKKNLARKKKKLSEAAKERGEKENVLAAKAYFKALRIKAGLKINEETFSNIPWDDWIEDWNENGNSELNVADWLKEAGLEKYVREAMDLQQIVKYFGNINNLIGAWAANYNISNYNWPLEPWKYLVVKSNINKNMILSISHMQHNTLKRWFSYLRPITAQNLIDIDRLLKNPITTKVRWTLLSRHNFLEFKRHRLQVKG